MVKKMIGFFDLAMSMVLAVLFLPVVTAAFIVSKVARRRRREAGDIKELFLSIVDIRESVISTQKEDMLLKGFIKKVFCFYFDFEKASDEVSYFGEDIHVNIVSVHPDNAFTRLGLKKSAACLVEMKAFFTMLAVVLNEGVNIIRAQDPHLLGFNAYLLSRLTKVPFIVQICSNYEVKDRQAKGLTFRPFIFKGVERRFERAIMRAADLVLTDREHYRSFGLIPGDIPEEKYGNMGFFVSDLHYASPESRKDLRGELKIGREKKVLLYVGRLSEVKFPLELVKMLAFCLEKRKDPVLLIAGEGALKDEMRKEAHRAGISDNIIFLQKWPQDRLPDLYHTADVVCFPSAGFTMIEAALGARCIVAYDFEWHSEFIGSNERGILVPFRDSRKFAEEVLRALEDQRYRDSLGMAAREYALRNYSRESAIAKEAIFYKRVLDRRGYNFEKTL